MEFDLKMPIEFFFFFYSKSISFAYRTAHSITKAQEAETVAQNAREEAHVARCVARDQDPNFKQPGNYSMFVEKKRGDYFKKIFIYFLEILTQTQICSLNSPQT